jgi:alpha/beta superfamily hydrolase
MPPALDPVPVVEDLFFPSGPYRLHGRLAYPEDGPVRGAAVLAGPHPLLGGHMDNNVVRALGDGLARRGLATLRFDYRGVGRSEGPPVDLTRHLAAFWRTGHAPDELGLASDVEAAAAELRRAVGQRPPLALAGYSFGCALLPHVRLPAAESPPVLVLVAPTVGRHDYDPYLGLANATLVVASEGDFASDPGRLRHWFGGRPAPSRLIEKPLDNHFLRGHEEWLTEAVSEYLADLWR